MHFRVARELCSGHRAWNSRALGEGSCHHRGPQSSLEGWGPRGPASPDSLIQGLADPSSQRALPGPWPPHLQLQDTVRGVKGGPSRCRPRVRAGPSRVLWRALSPALRAEMGIPDRTKRWHMYPWPSHVGVCDPLQMHPNRQGSRRTRSWHRLKSGRLLPLCLDGAGRQAGPRRRWLQSPPATLRPLTVHSLVAGAGHTDPRDRLSQMATRSGHLPSEPQGEARTGGSGPRVDDRSCQTPGNVSEGIFILRTSFYSRWGQEGDRVSLAPGLWE